MAGWGTGGGIGRIAVANYAWNRSGERMEEGKIKKPP
jgi:hypothetical protein